MRRIRTDAVWLAIACLIGSALFVVGCGSDDPVALTLEAGDFVRTVRTDEGERSFFVHVPPGLQPERLVPLIVVFHGAGQTPAGVREMARFDPEADRRGFVVVYPEGRERTWRVVGSDRDRDFLTTVVERVSADLPVDPARVFAVGISQGALMTHRMGCSASSPYVAIASVAASVSRFFDNCPGKGPVPALFFLGSEDPIYPWDEGAAAALGHYGGVGSAASWAARIGCTGTPEHTVLPPGADDGVTVEHWSYSGCPRGTVELYGMFGGGHTWPGSAQPASSALGRNTQDIDASSLILDFLLAL